MSLVPAVFHVDHRKGTLLAATGVTVLSVDALLIRLADAPAPEIAFWRGLFIAFSLALVYRLRRGRWPWGALRKAGRPAVALVTGFGLMQLCFVGAVSNTTVANALVILAAAPLFAAAFSGLFLREWVPLRTWLAIAAAIIGILVVFGGSVGLGNWLGDAIALGGATAIGATYTILRRTPNVSRLAVLSGGSLASCLVISAFAEPVSVGVQSMAVLALMGLILMPVAMVLMTQATRYLPAAEVSLFFTAEAVLGTLWVWLALGEEPPPLTLFGGAVVIAALALNSWIAARQRRTL